jgi:HNH endonuclease
VIHPATALRLACDCRLQAVLEDRADHALGIGRTSRVVPRWLARQLLQRDRGCTFPGCGATAFLHAHHIVHWLRGGPTELDNLCLLCSYHHKLVHEYGWWMVLADQGTTIWYRPSGALYDPVGPGGGRAPPERTTA